MILFLRRNIEEVLLAFTGALSFFAWAEIYFFHNFSFSVTSTTVLLFSLLGIAFFVLSVLINDVKKSRVLVLLLGVPPVVFAWDFTVTITSLVAMGLIWWGVVSIRTEEQERIHFHFYRVCTAGKSAFVAGLSLLLAVSYFHLTQQVTWDEVAEAFHTQETSADVLFAVTKRFFPELAAKETSEPLSVREYLDDQLTMTNAQEEAPTLSVEFIPGLEQYIEAHNLRQEALRGLSLESRVRYNAFAAEELGVLLGRPVDLSESFSVVVSEYTGQVLETKLSRFDAEAQTRVPVWQVTGLLSLAVFLLLYPTVSLLAFVWMFVAHVLILLLIPSLFVWMQLMCFFAKGFFDFIL